MSQTLTLRGKWSFHAHGQRIVLSKKSNEGLVHVLMKALLWGLYLPAYPELRVEFAVGSRFKPDLVQLDSQGEVEFWAEAGKVSAKKMRTLVSRHRRTHFAFAKWETDLSPFCKILDKPMKNNRREAPVDLISFPRDSAEKFIGADGNIAIRLSDLTWFRISA